MADDAARPSGALDRGSPRAPERRRQLPRASLPHHRLCRPRWQAARHRLQGDGRFRRVLVLSVLGLPRSGTGGEHPAGPLRFRRPIAARPGRWRPTNARSCPIAASRAPACALPSNWCSMPSPAKRGSSRTRCASGIWCGRSRCRSTTSPRSISTAAIIRKRCGVRWRISTFRRCGRARPKVSRTAGCSDSGSRSIASRRAHGTSVYAGWGIPMVPGHEQATARVTPDGGLELRVGVHSHGQGLETTLAQVAFEILGIDTAKVKVILGDTALTPYSTGTWGSRCMVMAGGAVASACREIEDPRAADRRQPAAGQVRGRQVRGRQGGLGHQRRQHAGYRARLVPAPAGPARRRSSRRPRGHRRLQARARQRHVQLCGACRDRCRRSGDSATSRFSTMSIVEDGGKLVNPMVVDGQIYGGLAQGIGTALYEEMPFDEQRPAAGGDVSPTICCPGPTEVPEPSSRSYGDTGAVYRIRRQGNRRGRRDRAARCDRQRGQRRAEGVGCRVVVSPITPRRVLEAIATAKVRRASAALAAGASS